MRLLNLLTKSFFISFVFVVTPVQAKVLDDHNALCPHIERVRQAAPLINTAVQGPGNYLVYTDTPVFEENGIAWKVGMPFVLAQSESEAITLGQKGVASIVSVLNKEAFDWEGLLLCGYYIKANTIAVAFVGDLSLMT